MMIINKEGDYETGEEDNYEVEFELVEGGKEEKSEGDEEQKSSELSICKPMRWTTSSAPTFFILGVISKTRFVFC